jgi:hypothetical protein
MVTLLINAGAQVNAPNKEAGITPLMDAVFLGRFDSKKHVDASYDILYPLLRAGADYELKNGHNYSAYSYANESNVARETAFWSALGKCKDLIQEREKRAKDGLVPKKTLQHTFDYLVDGPLSITPLCTIFTQYADHDRPYTPAEAAQRAAAANIKQAQIKRERMEAAARRRAEQSLK